MSNVRPQMKRSTTVLVKESSQATKLLAGKVVARIVRHRETEVLVEFTDGTRLFIDHSAHKLEVSITGPDEE